MPTHAMDVLALLGMRLEQNKRFGRREVNIIAGFLFVTAAEIVFSPSSILASITRRAIWYAATVPVVFVLEFIVPRDVLPFETCVTKENEK